MPKLIGILAALCGIFGFVFSNVNWVMDKVQAEPASANGRDLNKWLSTAKPRDEEEAVPDEEPVYVVHEFPVAQSTSVPAHTRSRHTYTETTRWERKLPERIPTVMQNGLHWTRMGQINIDSCLILHDRQQGVVVLIQEYEFWVFRTAPAEPGKKVTYLYGRTNALLREFSKPGTVTGGLLEKLEVTKVVPLETSVGPNEYGDDVYWPLRAESALTEANGFSGVHLEVIDGAKCFVIRHTKPESAHLGQYAVREDFVCPNHLYRLL